jgi:pyruvate,water dikinase
MPDKKFIRFFSELGIKDVPEVGGKNASLGEMYSHLTKKGLRVPNGFATTASAYRYFLETSGLKKRIKEALKGLDTKNVKDLMKRGAAVRKLIMDTALPEDFSKEIIISYRKLSALYKTKKLDVAVRSSATAEDLPDASFAGQQETFLNIVGEKELLLAVKKCIASLFTNRAISYRVDKKFDHFSIALSVGVQKMVRSDLGSSGVMFTIDTESGFNNAVLINSIFGLGENIVQGKVTPDEFYVFKQNNAIISKILGKKDIKMVYNLKGKKPVKDVKIPAIDQYKPSLNDKQIKELAKWGMIIEKHYNRPMDIEFALDGRTNELFITQARPETVQSQKDWQIIENYKLEKKGKIITEGQSVGNKIGVGIVNRILDVKDISTFKKGDCFSY